MALAGHDVVVTAASSASGAVSVLDGIKSFTLSDSRDLLDITDFNDGNVRARLAALRDYSISLSGDFEPSDAGYSRLKSHYEAGLGNLALRIHWGGAAGASQGFMYLCAVESIEINGAVDGKLEVSISAMASTGTTPFTHV